MLIVCCEDSKNDEKRKTAPPRAIALCATSVALNVLSCGNVLRQFVELLKEVTLFLAKKNQNYPEMRETTWLIDLHFFANFTMHYNTLNTKLQGCENTTLSMFGHVKAFEKKLAVFSADLEQGKLKYFPQLQKHFTSADLTHDQKQNALNKYVSQMKKAKNVMSERFAQFRQLDATLQFIFFPHAIHLKILNCRNLNGFVFSI